MGFIVSFIELLFINTGLFGGNKIVSKIEGKIRFPFVTSLTFREQACLPLCHLFLCNACAFGNSLISVTSQSPNASFDSFDLQNLMLFLNPCLPSN